jgi:hypothetical protein
METNVGKTGEPNQRRRRIWSVGSEQWDENQDVEALN